MTKLPIVLEAGCIYSYASDAVCNLCFACNTSLETGDVVQEVLERFSHRLYIIHLNCWDKLTIELKRRM